MMHLLSVECCLHIIHSSRSKCEDFEFSKPILYPGKKAGTGGGTRSCKTNTIKLFQPQLLSYRIYP